MTIISALPGVFRHIPTLVALYGCFAAQGAFGESTARSVLATCSALDRQAIDCACVGRRVERMQSALPPGVDASFLKEGYRAMTGSSNRFLEATEVALSDPQRVLQTEQALAAFGGRPGSVEDYEDGCVVADAPKATLPSWPREPATEGYVASCVASSGDTRYCECLVARARSHVDARGFEAYFRSFSDYSDDEALSLEAMSAARAAAMDMSVEDYERLRNRARGEIDARSDLDSAYCSAMLWADRQSGEDPSVVAQRYGEGEARAASAGGGAASVATPDIASAYPRALDVVAKSCARDGIDEAACGCLLNSVEAEVFPRADSEEVALAYALISFGGDPRSMQEIARLSPQQQMAAGLLSAQSDPMASCY